MRNAAPTYRGEAAQKKDINISSCFIEQHTSAEQISRKTSNYTDCLIFANVFNYLCWKDDSILDRLDIHAQFECLISGGQTLSTFARSPFLMWENMLLWVNKAIKQGTTEGSETNWPELLLFSALEKKKRFDVIQVVPSSKQEAHQKFSICF